MMAGPRADIRNDENKPPCYLKFPGFDKLALGETSQRIGVSAWRRIGVGVVEEVGCFRHA